MSTDDTLPAGVYLDRSYSCILLRVTRRGTAMFIPLASLAVEKMDMYDFLKTYDRWLPDYPLSRAARIYLDAGHAARMTDRARAELHALCDTTAPDPLQDPLLA